MENQIDISFIIPVYNAEKYLIRCINSICEQTSISKEIIAVDDGSTDDSYNVLQQLRESITELKIIKQKNQGASVARNRGIEEAVGKWICFIDSDDYLSKGVFFGNIKSISSEVQIVFFDYTKVRGRKKILYKHAEKTEYYNKKMMDDIVAAVLNKTKCPNNLQVFTPWAKLYKKDFLQKNGIRFTPGIRKSQDILFNFEVFCKAERGIYIPQNMYYYCYNKESLCNKYMDGVINDFISQQDKILKIIIENAKDDVLLQFHMRCIVNFLTAIRLDYANKDNKKAYKIRKCEFIRALDKEVFQKAFREANLDGFSIIEKIYAFSTKERFFLVVCILNRIYGVVERYRI